MQERRCILSAYTTIHSCLQSTVPHFDLINVHIDAILASPLILNSRIAIGTGHNLLTSSEVGESNGILFFNRSILNY